MNLFYLSLGLAMLVLAIVDLLWTTLWVDGGSGPLSSRLSTAIWRVLRQFGGERSLFLSLAGPIILVLTLVTWVGLIWFGWTFIFGASPHALIAARDEVPVTWTGRFFYVGYTMFTMGNGDFYPPVGIWQIASGLTTATGMMFVTMGVSYILSVLGAVATKRSFASSVSGMGNDSETVVTSAWTEEDLTGLHLQLSSLSAQLDTLADQHKSYPILHYYHSEQAEQASAMAVAIFDESLTLLRFGVKPEARPDHLLVKTSREATQNYLDTLKKSYIQPSNDPPPSPNLDRLREAGIPTVDDEQFDKSLTALSDRRRSLLGIVHGDAWEWPPIHGK